MTGNHVVDELVLAVEPIQEPAPVATLHRTDEAWDLGVCFSMAGELALSLVDLVAVPADVTYRYRCLQQALEVEATAPGVKSAY